MNEEDIELFESVVHTLVIKPEYLDQEIIKELVDYDYYVEAYADWLVLYADLHYTHHALIYDLVCNISHDEEIEPKVTDHITGLLVDLAEKFRWQVYNNPQLHPLIFSEIDAVVVNPYDGSWSITYTLNYSKMGDVVNPMSSIILENFKRWKNERLLPPNTSADTTRWVSAAV